MHGWVFGFGNGKFPPRRRSGKIAPLKYLSTCYSLHQRVSWTPVLCSRNFSDERGDKQKVSLNFEQCESICQRLHRNWLELDSNGMHQALLPVRSEIGCFSAEAICPIECYWKPSSRCNCDSEYQSIKKKKLRLCRLKIDS